jgi:hypothetical protein
MWRTWFPPIICKHCFNSMEAGEVFCRICGRSRFLPIKKWQVAVFVMSPIIFMLFPTSSSSVVSEISLTQTLTSTAISGPTATFEIYTVSPSLTPNPTSTQKPQPTNTATLKPSPTRTPRPSQTPTHKPSSTPTRIPPSSITCSGAPPTRLNTGMRAKVTFTDGTPGSVRPAPASRQILGRVPEGITMSVVGRPRWGIPSEAPIARHFMA